MQEGTSRYADGQCALAELRKRLPFISIPTDPTTGGTANLPWETSSSLNLKRSSGLLERVIER